MIGALTHNMEEVGYYEQAQKIVKAGLMVVNALQIVMNSRIANAYANRDKKEVHDCLEKSFKFVWLLALPMMFGLIGIATKFVPWYYGKGFDGVTGILMMTSPILIAIGLNGITGIQYLVQVGKQNVFTKSVIVGCLVNVLCNLLFIPSYGGIGAAIASVLAEFCIFLYQMKYFKKEFNFFQIIRISIKNVISGIVMLISVMILTNYLTVSIWNTLIEVVLGGIVYVGLLLLLKDEFLISLVKQIYLSIKRVGDKLLCKG